MGNLGGEPGDVHHVEGIATAATKQSRRDGTTCSPARECQVGFSGGAWVGKGLTDRTFTPVRYVSVEVSSRLSTLFPVQFEDGLLTVVVIYDNMRLWVIRDRHGGARKTRPVSWIKGALKEFETFPEAARSIFLTALTIAAEGAKADIAKPCTAWGPESSRSRWRSNAMPFG